MKAYRLTFSTGRDSSNPGLYRPHNQGLGQSMTFGCLPCPDFYAPHDARILLWRQAALSIVSDITPGVPGHQGPALQHHGGILHCSLPPLHRLHGHVAHGTPEDDDQSKIFISPRAIFCPPIINRPAWRPTDDSYYQALYPHYLPCQYSFDFLIHSGGSSLMTMAYFACWIPTPPPPPPFSSGCTVGALRQAGGPIVSFWILGRWMDVPPLFSPPEMMAGWQDGRMDGWMTGSESGLLPALYTNYGIIPFIDHSITFHWKIPK